MISVSKSEGASSYLLKSYHAFHTSSSPHRDLFNLPYLTGKFFFRRQFCRLTVAWQNPSIHSLRSNHVLTGSQSISNGRKEVKIERNGAWSIDLSFYGRINGLSSLPRHAWERSRGGKPVSPRQPVSQERDTGALVQFACS